MQLPPGFGVARLRALNQGLHVIVGHAPYSTRHALATAREKVGRRSCLANASDVPGRAGGSLSGTEVGDVSRSLNDPPEEQENQTVGPDDVDLLADAVVDRL